MEEGTRTTILMLCLDTYALIEIHNENPRFTTIIEQAFIIPDLIMTEFYSFLYKKYNEQTAEYWLKKFQLFVTKTELHTLITATKYRIRNKKNLSFYDCVGYITAQEANAQFVTGDKAFKGLKNVKFMKA